MRAHLLALQWATAVVLLPFSLVVSATDTTAASGDNKSTEETVRKLEQRVKKLEQEKERKGAAKKKGFNPAISLVLNGTASSFKLDADNYTVPGFVLAEETGPGEEGFSLAETELVMSANIDHRFFGRVTIAITPENEAELEEAFVRTLSLPGGFTIQAGRFFSEIGYLNPHHAHTWDFVDAPLVYRTLLGRKYLDDGVQVRWLAPTDLYFEIGVEWFRGERFPGGGADNDGKGAYSVTVTTGGDIGSRHSWQLGLWSLQAKADGRETDTLTFTGDSRLHGVDFIWKSTIGQPSKNRKMMLLLEYIRRKEDGLYNGITVPYKAEQKGWVAQWVLQFNKRWRFGLRTDSLKADNPGVAFAGTALDPQGHDPRRNSAMIDYSFSENSRIRLQYNNDESGPIRDKQWYLQYIMNIGAHGAHRF